MGVSISYVNVGFFVFINCIFKSANFVSDSRVINSLANIIKEANTMTAEWPILVIGTALDQKQMSNNLISAFLHTVQMMVSIFFILCSSL